MFCNECGTQLSDNALFCPNCGKKMTNNDVSVNEAYLHPPQKTVTVTPAGVADISSPKKKPIMAITIGGILIFAAAIGIFLIVGKQTKEKSSFSETEATVVENSISKENPLDNNINTENPSADDVYAETVPEQTSNETLDSDLDEKNLEGSIEYDNEPISTNTDENAEYILPESDSKYLQMSDLEGMTADDCRMARNELFARHGRLFNDEELQAYFNSKNWYKGTIEPNDFSDDMFNKYELANRDLIIKFEEEQGYR